MSNDDQQPDVDPVPSGDRQGAEGQSPGAAPPADSPGGAADGGDGVSPGNSRAVDDGPPDEGDETDFGEVRRGTTYIINNIENVRSETATFGSGERWRLAASGSGQLKAGEVADSLCSFVEPHCYGQAVIALAEHHLLVLLGEEGIGKSLSAMALLHRDVTPGRDISTLSPGLIVEELVGFGKYSAGTGFLVLDLLQDERSAAARLHQFDLLAEKVKKAQAYLVITASPEFLSRNEHRPWAIRWRPPDPVEFFDTYLADLPGDQPMTEIVSAARERASQAERPQDVLDLLSDVTGDAESTGRIVEARVTSWFDSKPTTEEIVRVVAAAFTDGAGEPDFERYQHLLKGHMLRATSELRPTLPRWDEPMVEDRVLRGGDLLTASRPSGGGVREVGFISGAFRAHCLDELHRRYGYPLWSAVRPWLDELSAQEPYDVQVQIAAGMALLGRRSFDEVADQLNDWSNGVARQRMAAAFSLSWMCADSSTARLALKLAIGWTSQRGSRRAEVAAVGFSSGLGLHFPDEAVRWLWFLSSRGSQISRIARTGLGVVVALSTEQDQERALTLIQMLADYANQTAGRGDLGRWQAGQNALTVLSSRREADGASVPAHLLRTVPDSVRSLGTLWSLAIQVGTIRDEAIHTLYTALASLQDESEVRPTAALLGERILSRLTPRQVERLTADLAGLQRRAGAPANNEYLIEALISVLENSAGRVP
jgi:hypothetical protein